jgi:dTDP-4-amino-4,6-dideoxygalactose transaminase
MIPSANPKAGYIAHRKELDAAYDAVIETGQFILGPRVRSFEKHFAAYIGVSDCIGVASGTDAIQLSLRACGVAKGDGVITVSHTAVATVSAIDWMGARPILVDIDPKTFTIDPQKVFDTLKQSPRGHIKAIVAVHLYGHPADIAALTEIADQYGIYLIEDCAQAHGATINQRKVGSFGICGAFSFYPTKNLGAFGDGGAVVTNDAKIAQRIRLMQQYGWRDRYISNESGYNSRLDELQAAFLDCKLQWLDSDNEQRREIARLYNDNLSRFPLQLPFELPFNRHVYHQYTIRSSKRNDMRRYLERHDIGTAILYPMPIHLQPGYRNRITIGHGGLNITEQTANDILCLPIFPELPHSDVTYIIDSIANYFKI